MDSALSHGSIGVLLGCICEGVDHGLVGTQRCGR